MPFWGIEIKPGKPYSHKHDVLLGRLRISQAILGHGKSTNKCTVQCNVGNKSPILLCNLIPNVFENCHLELEFEELQDVVFSVLGQRSVHLSGYYVGGSGRDLDGDNTDSYGEDIADTDASDSYNDSDDEDEYESDFIDDDDYKMFSASPRRKSGVVIEEIIEDDKPSNGNANRRRLKKKNQLSDSDDGSDDSQGQLVVKRNRSVVIESEDEDGFPISFSSRKKNVVNDSEGISNLKSDDKTVIEDTEKKIDTRQENIDKSKKKKKKKKAKDEKPLETTPKAPAVERTSVEPDQDKDDHKDNEVQVGEANVDQPKTSGADGTYNEGKSKKKNKKTKKGKITEAGADASAERSQDKSTEDTNKEANNDKVDQDPPFSGELEKLPSQIEVVDPSVSGKVKKKNKKKRAKHERGSDAEGGEVSDVNPNDAKKKKKESKNNDKDLALFEQTPTQESEQGESEVTKYGHKKRTFANGLVIEELAMGKPDGKRATKGKQIHVKYIGKLKDGTIFDSTVGKRPFFFPSWNWTSYQRVGCWSKWHEGW